MTEMLEAVDFTSLYPVLPLRDIVVFPHMIVPLFVGREKSIRALDEVVRDNQKILLVTQKDAKDDEPQVNNIYRVGTLGTVLQLLKLPDGTVKVLVEGGPRVRVLEIFEEDPYYKARVAAFHENADEHGDLQPLCRAVVAQFEQYIKLNKKVPPEVLTSVNQIEDAAQLSDTVASYLTLKIPDKQDLLEIATVQDRLEKVFALMEGEIGVLQVEKRIRSRVKRQMEKTQREYYLNEQLKAIQKELGDGEDGRDETAELEKKIETLKLSKEAKTKCRAELKKLKNMSPMSAEATVVRNYLDWILSLPWGKRSKLKHDIRQAKVVMDTDHYGLEKVKDRILEFLAVQQRVGKMKGSILCLVGPPGVGKTSLGKSIAQATGRTFVRLSLGGVRDEAEIRGHRRTYIGSMPGKIVQSMKKAKTNNPLFLLDEIDKLGQDWRGDPSSALLEVLDPEQNHTFNDHYLELDYDLSDVMFIATANTLNMPQPLLDRMEIIRIPGYTEDEKLEISRRHLIPKQMEAAGLKNDELVITDDAMRKLIRTYTREAGVRNLEREIANLCRKSVKEILEKSKKKVLASAKTLNKYAGVPRFRYGEVETEDSVGVTTGLAWTEAGGDILQIESVTVPGSGKIKCTGKLGEVMQESVSAADSFVRSRSALYGINPKIFEKRDIHVHVPEGATPKDGPSAGVAIMISIVSVLTGVPVRRDVAMTGEITLRGRVLPIGGLKEKLLAALRAGIKTVLIPQENEKDLEEIPDNVKKGLTIIPVATADQALAIALSQPLTPVVFPEEDSFAVKAAPVAAKQPVVDGAQTILPH